MKAKKQHILILNDSAVGRAVAEPDYLDGLSPYMDRSAYKYMMVVRAQAYTFMDLPKLANAPDEDHDWLVGEVTGEDSMELNEGQLTVRIRSGSTFWFFTNEAAAYNLRDRMLNSGNIAVTFAEVIKMRGGRK